MVSCLLFFFGDSFADLSACTLTSSPSSSPSPSTTSPPYITTINAPPSDKRNHLHPLPHLSPVAALGNKPAGSKWWYIAVMCVFAILFGIALFCTGWTIYLAVPHTAAGWRDISSLLDQSAFRVSRYTS